MPHVEDSLARLRESSERIAKLPFDSTKGFSRAVLLSTEKFEAQCIREASTSELTLFQARKHSSSKPQIDLLQRVEQATLSISDTDTLKRNAASKIDVKGKGRAIADYTVPDYLVAADQLLQL